MADLFDKDDKKIEQQAASPGEASASDGQDGAQINDNALLRKLDFKLLPAVGILYLLSFLDRSNGSSQLSSKAVKEKLTPRFDKSATRASRAWPPTCT